MGNITLSEIGNNTDHPCFLSSVYEREDVEEGITSGCGYVLPAKWYLQDIYHHCVFFKEPLNELLGSMFYELLEEGRTARVHVNIFPRYQYKDITTPCGKLLMHHLMRRYPTLHRMEGLIPATNKAAQRYAVRMGWEKIETLWSPIPGDVYVYEYSLTGGEL